jgi:predicted cupin superfamily sugar epimerase
LAVDHDTDRERAVLSDLRRRKNRGRRQTLCSAIIALLVDDPTVFSDMHRLPTDELWHFYLGDPIELLLLYSDGSDELVILGQDVLAGQRIQTVVPAGTYMGARLRPGGDYGVYGNTMAPGFVLSDFESAGAEELIARWPHRAGLIQAMTRLADSTIQTTQ